MRKFKKTLCLILVFILMLSFNTSFGAVTGIGDRTSPDTIIIFGQETAETVQEYHDSVVLHCSDWYDEFRRQLEAEQNMVVEYYFGWSDEMLAIIAEQDQPGEYYFGWSDEMLAIIAEQDQPGEYYFGWSDEMLAIIAEQDQPGEYHFGWSDEMLAIIQGEQDSVIGFDFRWCDEMWAQIQAEQDQLMEYDTDWWEYYPSWCNETFTVIQQEQDSIIEYYYAWCDELLMQIQAEQDQMAEYGWDEYFFYTHQSHPNVDVDFDSYYEFQQPYNYGVVEIVPTNIATLNLSTGAWNPTSVAQSININITSNRTWAIHSNVAWLTISNVNPFNRTGNGSFRINATANIGTASRMGIITVSAPGAPTRSILVTQAAPPATLTVSHTAWNPASAATNILVHVTSNRTWSVNSNVAWLTISSVSPLNRTGNGSFRINATANPGTGPRTGTITVSTPGVPTRIINVTQAVAPATLSLSRVSWSAPASASFADISVGSNRTWTATSNSTSWLTISNVNPPNRTGNGSFRINATANTGATQRTGTITVTAPGAPTRTISVTQPVAPATLSLSTASSNFTHAGGNSTILVTSNRTWTATSNQTSWLTVSNFSPTTRTGNGSFRINATANTGTTQRTGTITVTAPGAPTRTISVTQPVAPATLSLSTAISNFTHAGGSSTVLVTSNRTWTATSNQTSWLTVSNFSPTTRTGNGSFRINATANTGATQRTGTITVTAPGAPTRTISVTQPVAPATLSLSTAISNFTHAGGNSTVLVTSNRTWTVTSNQTSWLTVSNFSPANHTGNGSFRINATANIGATQRTGTITVTAPGAPTRTISVTQPVAPATLSLSTASSNFTHAGGNSTVLVTSNRTWAVSSNVAWLTVSNFVPTTRTGNGSFRINATTNIGTSPRFGLITVTAPGAPTRTISVTQAATPTLTISQAIWTPTAAASEATINVNSNGTWTATRNVAWLTISNTTPANRTGNGSFRITATANTSSVARVGTVTVTVPGAPTRTINVSQSAGRTVTLNPNGGTLSQASILVPPGTAIGNLPTPFRHGHVFSGWFDAQTGGTQVLPTRIINNNMTIFARWGVNITLNPNGGTVSQASLPRVGGTPIGTLPTPTRTGFRFEGWFTAVTGGTQILATTPTPNNNTTLHARWSLIWHSNSNWVGFWPGTITTGTAVIRGDVPIGFNLGGRLTESRTRWANALDVSITSTSHLHASIQVFGGSPSEMQEESGNFDTWAGLASFPTRTRAGTVTVNNITRTVYRFSGQARTFVNYRTEPDDCSVCTEPEGCPHCPQAHIFPAGLVRAITVHELGHALGYAGHAPNSTDIMYFQLPWNTQGNLSANEIRHLRQIYDAFRQ